MHKNGGNKMCGIPDNGVADCLARNSNIKNVAVYCSSISPLLLLPLHSEGIKHEVWTYYKSPKCNMLKYTALYF